MLLIGLINTFYAFSLTKPFELNGIMYEVDDEANLTVCVTKSSDYSFYKGMVNIPATISYDNKTYTVTRIEHDAFRAQTGLTAVVLPKTLKNIGYKAFQGANSLRTIAFSSAGVLETIEYNAFKACRSLTNLTFPASLKTIGEYAFEDCVGLKTINFGGVEIIEKAAFKGCDNLVEIEITDSVREIGEMAFWTCSALRRAKLGKSVEIIGPDAFLDCHELEDINLPESLTELGYEAFRGCWGLSEVVLPNSLKTMGYGVYRYCVSLKKITLSENLTEIPPLAFEQTDLEEITIPNSIKSIGGNAFIECNLLRNVNFGNGVERIGESAFQSCPSLTSIILKEPLKEIGATAFANCKNLEYVSIPRTVWSINKSAFGNCPNLARVDDLATTPQEIYNCDVFVKSGPEGYVNVHVYEGLYDLYMSTMGWYDIGTQYTCGVRVIADIPVKPIEAIQFTENEIYCAVGEMKKANVKVLPSDAMMTDLIWSTDNESVLFVDMYSGEFIGMDKGEATLTVKVKDNEKVSASIKVIVLDKSSVESAIDDVENEMIIYDLFGRRLNSLQPGINIVNGKKILVK